MIPNHYECLGVAPGAEDAVIRAAYRALMRLYHPDMNDDGQAQSRVREITAAFAVLRDPQKRAAYDAQRAFGIEPGSGQPAWFAADRRSAPPLRKLGLASVALALALSLAFAVGPEWRPATNRQALRAVAANSSRPRLTPAANIVAAPKKVVALTDAGRVSREDAAEPVPPPRPARDATSEQSNSRPLSVPREIARVEVPKAAAPTPVAARQTASAASGPATLESCGQGSSTAANGECADNRQAQIERTATGFLNQSMEHADWRKQQLLLSARNRSATSRTLCRSDDCVTEAYMRQIRDITAIMAGRIPNP